MTKKLIFSIDGVLLSDYGINVESCTGLLNVPKRKPQIVNDDLRSHGKFYDLGSLPKYSERVITLNCFVSSKSRLEAFININSIIGIFDGAGYHRLTAALGSEIELPYEVLRTDGTVVDPTWDSIKTVAKFKLQLIEPIPVKRVVVANGGGVDIQFHTEKLVSISWGDNTYSYDLLGDVDVSKNLPAGTQIVIMGDIEEITNFTLTGGTVQWDIWS